MIRLTLLSLFISFLCIYAWKDWYKSLCGLIVLMSVIEHPDMPKSFFEIQGLSPWNIVIVFILSAYFMNKRNENSTFKLPTKIKMLFFLYISIISIAFIRLASKIDIYNESMALLGVPGASVFGMFSDHILNSIKWLIPGILLAYGANDKKRIYWAIVAILLIYIILAVQVIKWMPISKITDAELLKARSLKLLANEIGYHRVNLSMMLAGGSWAIACSMVIFKKYRWLLFLLFIMVFVGQALTGGRTGYVTWVLIGISFGFLKWRKIILLLPVVLIAIVALVPAIKDRMLEGFSEQSIDRNVRIEETTYDNESGPNIYTITSGRNFAWKYVVDQIKNKPFFGHGKEAMITTGTTMLLYQQFGESFPHPHNAYLELLIDNGIIGAVPVFLLFYILTVYSIRLFLSKEDDVSVVVGGVALSLMLAHLIASFGSQSFYPKEGSVGMWSALGLVMRVYLSKSQKSNCKATR